MSSSIYVGLEMAWCIVFICRLWWAWLQHTEFFNEHSRTTESTRQTKQNFFITKTCFISVEINAHMLLYIIELVKQKKLPKKALNIYLFNSQPCESMFRSARALSEAFQLS